MSAESERQAVMDWVRWIQVPHKFDHDPYSTLGPRMCGRCQHGANTWAHNSWRLERLAEHQAEMNRPRPGAPVTAEGAE